MSLSHLSGMLLLAPVLVCSPAHADEPDFKKAEAQARRSVQAFAQAYRPAHVTPPADAAAPSQRLGCAEAAALFEQGRPPSEADLAGEHLGVACFKDFPGREYAARLLGLQTGAEGRIKLFASCSAATDGRGYPPGHYDAPLAADSLRSIVDRFLPDYSFPTTEENGVTFDYLRKASGNDPGYWRTHEVRQTGTCLIMRDTGQYGLDSITVFCRHRPISRLSI